MDHTFFVVLTLLLVKHFLCDFPFQKAWMYQNKGVYFHLGGLTHAALHGVFTFFVFFFFSPAAAFFSAALGLLDFFIHYHIDWAKVKLAAHWHLDASTSYFWWLLGLDQLLHQITYLVLLHLSHASLTTHFSS
jgi:Protein of unknown function (DUF3307)